MSPPRQYLLLANVLLRLWMAKAGFLCTPDSGTFASYSTYEDNLKELLSIMAYSTPIEEAYHDSVGYPPNEVFGSALCLNTRSPSLGRWDSDPVCAACMESATENALLNCSNMKEGVGSFDDCIMAWSDTNHTTSEATPQGVNSPRPPRTEGGSKSALVVAVVVPIVVCMCVLAVLAFVLFRMRRRTPKPPLGPMPPPMEPPVGPMPRPSSKPVPDPIIPQGVDATLFDYEVLRWATNNFSKSNMLGRGGFGPVFKGTLQDGRQVAVKKLEKLTPRGIEELLNEVKIVTRLRQKFLVKVLGYCLEQNEFLLVYEFLPNTSLDKFLLDPKRCAWLPWATRFNIIKGISRGLLYLHEEFEGGQVILHRDLKASNILLDENMNPKISDFGLARLHTDDQTHASTTTVAGTLGYMAPEYIFNGTYSRKSDVYSFGIIVLEIVTGHIINSFQGPAGQSLLSYVKQHWNEEQPLNVLDKRLGGICSTDEVELSLYIGLSCTQEGTNERPEMAEVVGMLTTKAPPSEPPGANPDHAPAANIAPPSGASNFNAPVQEAWSSTFSTTASDVSSSNLKTVPTNGR